ncbi:helix-turn-helix domain-containing protein [Evansella halocellulosilytica]|uniref:helix-turn-helix domain-containing protein n=1 Tax=Evansella halocellulosilytica TaxID=2011013 RepID=UPI0015CBDE62|nr:RodZ domain-containing protein [Evansella halocellulosilytica]
MSELGQRLKAAREENGFSLEELQTRTKIQKRYLIAMEDGDFSRLPGEFYARAFVKSYAEAVGLNPEVLFEEHKDELPQPKKEPAELPTRVNRSKPKVVKKKSKTATLVPTLIAVLFILLILGGVWMYGQNNDTDPTGVSRDESQGDSSVDIDDTITDDDDDETEEEDENEESAAESEEDDAEEEEDHEEQPQVITLESTEGYTSTFTLSDTDEFDVRMEVTGQSWIEVRDSDNSALVSQTYDDGDEITFDFSDESEIVFNLGSAATVDIYINDELFEYPIENTRQYIIIEFEQ